MSQHTSIELVKVYFYISEERLELISPIYCRSLLWNVDCGSKYSLRCWLQSSPCPRRPPPPLVLPIVALGGGVGEGGEPGAHQARHHLPVVVVVASWGRSKTFKAIGGMKYTMSSDADLCFNSTHFALQAELEYLATSRAGRRSGLEGPPARWLGSQSCCTEAAGKRR